MIVIIKWKPVVFIGLLIKALTMLMMPKFIGPMIRVLKMLMIMGIPRCLWV